MKSLNSKTVEAVTNNSGAMEFRDHFKNGRSSKSLRVEETINRK